MYTDFYQIIQPEIHLITLTTTPASKKRHSNWFMLFREVTAVYSENPMEDIK
jgi:hypothetical protein